MKGTMLTLLALLFALFCLISLLVVPKDSDTRLAFLPAMRAN
jgi:hypothetical protein